MLAYILGVLLIASVIGNFCRFVGEYYGSVVGARTLLDLRRLMYAKALTLPMTTYLTRGVSDTMSRFVQDTQDVLSTLRVLFSKVLREPLKAVAAFLIALSLAPRLTLVLVVGSLIAAVVFREFGRLTRRANKRRLMGYARLLCALESTLTGLRVVKAYTMENRERKRYFRVERDILRHQLRIDMIRSLSSPTLEVLAIAAVFVGILWVMPQFMEGEQSSADMGTLLVALVAMADPMRKLSNTYNSLQRANAGAKRIFELIDTPTEFERRQGPRTAGRPSEGIVFRDVTFTYPGSDHPAVKGVDLNVAAGTVVAIVGPNGCGKTTLVSLLMRLFDPQEGQILWDGVDVGEFRLRSLRQQMSYVSQETVIFADTIRNNIAYGNSRASDEQIVHASTQAHAHEFIERLPQGYDTIVGEHGVTLSGGERQRLAISRAILRDAPVLIFDEATSQIDAESEQKIQDAIDHFMPGRTAMVIAHRFSTIAKANLIVVMDRGQIIGAGNHKELMGSSGLYRTLYQTQLHGLEQA